MWKQSKPFLQENNELVCHLLELVNVTVTVDITETCPDRVIDEQDIGKFIPGAIDQLQVSSLPHSVWSNLHQGAVFGTAARTTVQPNHRPRPVREVLIFKMPEE
jgi:hypothetical protein